MYLTYKAQNDIIIISNKERAPEGAKVKNYGIFRDEQKRNQGHCKQGRR